MSEAHELYPDPPRRVVLTLATLRSLTVLERARACAVAGVSEHEIAKLLEAVSSKRSDPETLETGVTVLYAMLWQLERRRDPAIEWAEVQRFDLALDLETGPDPIAEAEARAVVEAALVTGLSPAAAGELTLSELDAYGTVRAEAERAAARRSPPRRRAAQR